MEQRAAARAARVALEDRSDPARVEALEVLRALDQSGASPCRAARRPCRRSCGRVWSRRRPSNRTHSLRSSRHAAGEDPVVLAAAVAGDDHREGEEIGRAGSPTSRRLCGGRAPTRPRTPAARPGASRPRSPRRGRPRRRRETSGADGRRRSSASISLVAHPGGEQLPPRHYSVLAIGDLTDHPVPTIGAFGSIWDQRPQSTQIRPPHCPMAPSGRHRVRPRAAAS